MWKPKIAIIIHAHYLDIFEEILSYLSNMPYNFDLHVNFSEVTNYNKNYIINIWTQMTQSNPDINFYRTTSSNRGQDLGGFFASTANAKKLGLSYDYVCKVHTKANGDNLILGFKGLTTKSQWRKELLTTLLGSQSRIEEILKIFKTSPEVGIISNDKYYCNLFYPNENKTNYDFFIKKLGLNSKHCWPKNSSFLAGTMFWMRGEIWDFLMESDITINDFEIGASEGDGLRSHGFERVFDPVVKHLGFVPRMIEEKA
jgi:rhamnosyltransferase